MNDCKVPKNAKFTCIRGSIIHAPITFTSCPGICILQCIVASIKRHISGLLHKSWDG